MRFLRSLLPTLALATAHSAQSSSLCPGVEARRLPCSAWTRWQRTKSTPSSMAAVERGPLTAAAAAAAPSALVLRSGHGRGGGSSSKLRPPRLAQTRATPAPKSPRRRAGGSHLAPAAALPRAICGAARLAHARRGSSGGCPSVSHGARSPIVPAGSQGKRQVAGAGSRQSRPPAPPTYSTRCSGGCEALQSRLMDPPARRRALPASPSPVAASLWARKSEGGWTGPSAWQQPRRGSLQLACLLPFLPSLFTPRV